MISAQERHQMKKLTLALMVAMAFVSFGCKKKGGGDTGAALAKMTEFKDEMCKCKDAACAQGVQDKMNKWSAEQQKTQKEPVKMNDADQKKFTDIGEEMAKCQIAATGPGSAGSAEGSAAGSAEGSGGSAAGSAEGAAGSAAGSAAAGSAAGSAAKKDDKKDTKKDEKKK